MSRKVPPDRVDPFYVYNYVEDDICYVNCIARLSMSTTKQYEQK